MKEWKFEGRPSIFVRDPNLQPSKATLEDLENSGVTRNTPRVSVGKVVESPKTVASKDSIMIERSSNYAFALSNSGLALSFSAIRDVSTRFYGWLPEKLKTSLYNDISRGVRALDSEPCLNTYMFALGKMHNAKLRKAYDHLSSEFLQQETVDIVDYGCGQAMGCICYADFLRENGIRQKVRRVVLIEPSELALKRAALHVSLMFPDAELRTVCKGFDDLLPEDLRSDTDTPTLHILSNVLDIGDQFYDLNKFADLVVNTIAGYNEFVCVEPLFCIANIDSRPARFFERLRIEPYFRFSAGKGEFVPGQTWTCALLLGTADKREKSQGMAVVWLNGKSGLIDSTGKELYSPKYEDIKDFYEDLAGIRLNDKWGFIDKTGQIVIQPKYDEILEGYLDSSIGGFHEGLAGIELNGKWGFIDKTGKEVIPSKYDNIWDFHEGLARTELNGKCRFIDKADKEVIPPKYDWIRDFHEGLAGFLLNGKRGFIDKSGQIVIPPKYDEIWDFHEGLAEIKLNGKWGFIDKTGRIVIPPKYDEIKGFHEGLAGIRLNGKWRFVDKSGQIVIPPKYDYIWNFHEGLAGIRLNGKCGFINKTGQIVIPPKYDWVGDFYESLAEFELNGKWGIINSNGEIVVPAQYNAIHLIRQ